jgi:2-methylcitrate dehydratase PrpD
VSEPAAGLTARLAAAIAGLRTEHIPEAAAATVRLGLTDCIGVMIAGGAEPVVARARAALGDSATAEARLIPGGASCSARDAALLNGIACHVLDYDDVALDGHPSALLVPALLAECEAVGATGADFMRGYVAGYETWGALWAAAAVPLHGLGRHPSSSFGPLCVAAGVASLRGLRARETAHALGLAAAQAGGLIANFGTMAKSFQTGQAAAAGLMAARFAAAGIEAAPDIIETKAGFLQAICGGQRDGAALGFGELGFGAPDWWILRQGLDIKLYPMCYAAHRLVDAALQLRRDHQFDLDDITAIDLRLGQLQSAILESTRPATGLAAKFSAEFAVAAALATGGLGLAALRPDSVARADIQALIARCTRRPDDDLAEQPFSPFDQVSLRLRDGGLLVSQKVAHATGSRRLPPTRAALRAKFLDATQGHWPGGDSARLFDTLWDLPADVKIAALLADCGIGGLA